MAGRSPGRGVRLLRHQTPSGRCGQTPGRGQKQGGGRAHQLPFQGDRLGSAERTFGPYRLSVVGEGHSHLTENAGSQTPPLEGLAGAGRGAVVEPGNLGTSLGEF